MSRRCWGLRRGCASFAAGLALALVVAPLVTWAADEPSAKGANPEPKQTVKEQLAEVWNRDLFTGDWEG